MKALCKLCGAVIETPPDPMMDADRDKRERTVFFNRIAQHIDPRTRLCTVNNQKLSQNRFVMLTQDNGWFQRWRLLACVDFSQDPKLMDKYEEWREYLHTITMAPVEAPPEPKKEKVN